MAGKDKTVTTVVAHPADHQYLAQTRPPLLHPVEGPRTGTLHQVGARYGVLLDGDAIELPYLSGAVEGVGKLVGGRHGPHRLGPVIWQRAKIPRSQMACQGVPAKATRRIVTHDDKQGGEQRLD